MKRILSLTLLFVLSSFFVFAHGDEHMGGSFYIDFSPIYFRDKLSEAERVPVPTPTKSSTQNNQIKQNIKASSEMSDYEWTLLKTFITLVMNSNNEYDDDSVFVSDDGQIRWRRMRGIDTYAFKDVSLYPFVDRRSPFAKSLSGTFSYSDRNGLYAASLSCVFPNIDDKTHRLEFKSSDIQNLNNGALVTLDNQTYTLSGSDIKSLMLSGYETALEYMF